MIIDEQTDGNIHAQVFVSTSMTEMVKAHVRLQMLNVHWQLSADSAPMKPRQEALPR